MFQNQWTQPLLDWTMSMLFCEMFSPFDWGQNGVPLCPYLRTNANITDYIPVLPASHDVSLQTPPLICFPKHPIDGDEIRPTAQNISQRISRQNIQLMREKIRPTVEHKREYINTRLKLMEMSFYISGTFLS